MGLAASLIIPTHRRADILRHCLSRLFAQTVPNEAFEILVVDDASPDDTESVVKAFAHPNLHYRKQSANRGAGAARNVAIAMAKGDILVFLDDDAFVRPDYLERHLKAHRDAEHANGDRHIVTGPIVEVSELPDGADETGNVGGWHGNPFPTGNASLKRDFVLQAGGFDESFGIYGWEDTELHRRLMRLNLNSLYVREAPIFHYKPQAVRQDFAARIRREQNRGRMGAMYYAKHPVFAVGWQTKQLPFFHGLDRVLTGLLGLETIAQRALKIGAAPSSAFLRLLAINHTEIASGRAEWERLGPETRAAMAAATEAMVKPKISPHPEPVEG